MGWFNQNKMHRNIIEIFWEKIIPDACEIWFKNAIYVHNYMYVCTKNNYAD